MKLVNPDVKVIFPNAPAKLLKLIERIARKCYKSEDKITETSYEGFIKRLIDSGHHSTIEHVGFTVDLTTDRGVSHEGVRHRVVAVSQESTRYANYSKDKFGNEIVVVTPFFFDALEETKPIQLPIIDYETGKLLLDNESDMTYVNSFDIWYLTCSVCEWGYMTLINEFKRTPQEARSVLPNSLKTELGITANLREWRHIFALRAVGTSGTPHPQMRQVMLPALKIAYEQMPIIFGDLYEMAVNRGLYNVEFNSGECSSSIEII